MFKKVLRLIAEGGNVFAGIEGETDKILREYIEPTMTQFAKEFKKVFPRIDLDFSDFDRVIRLGSVGKKDISGDIDIGIDAHEFMNEDGRPKFELLGFTEEEYQAMFDKFKKRSRTASDKKISIRVLLTLMARELNEKSDVITSSDKDVGSGAIFNSFPQYDENGQTVGKNVQIDINVGPLSWLKFSYYSAGSFEGNLKGLHRTQLIASIFDALGYQFKHEVGVDKNGETIATTPEEVVALLKENGLNIPIENINDFNKIVDVIDASPMKDKIYTAFLKGRLDTMRNSDIPTRMQDWWIEHKDELGLKGIWLPEDSSLFDKMSKEDASQIHAARAAKDAELMARKIAKADKARK